MLELVLHLAELQQHDQFEKNVWPAGSDLILLLQGRREVAVHVPARIPLPHGTCSRKAAGTK